MATPPGWLVRTIVDRIESLEPQSTGTGYGHSSELQKIRHYCPACRRKAAHAA